MVLVFSYGSNSIVQLQARVQNTTLTALPARAPGWRRIFCRNTTRWCGAAASIAPSIGGVVHGAVVNLTSDELARLDVFESGYDQKEIDLEVYEHGTWDGRTTAKVYISQSTEWMHPPSEQYLTAIHVMLREQFHNVHPEHALEIDVCGIISEKLEKVYTWRYPGALHLSLPALCVEVNAKRSVKWVMPQSISDLQAELRAVGVHSTPQLAVWLIRNGDGARSPVSGESDRGRLCLMDSEAVDLFRHLLQLGDA